MDSPSDDCSTRDSLSEEQAGFGADVANRAVVNFISSVVLDYLRAQRANSNDKAVEDLISEAALAQEVFGDADLERFAEEYRKNAK